MKPKPEFDRTYQDQLQALRIERLKDYGASQMTLGADQKIYEHELGVAKANHDLMTPEQYWRIQEVNEYFALHGCD